MTGFSSSIPTPDPATSGRNAPQVESPHAGGANQPEGSHPSHPGQQRDGKAFDASTYRSGPLPPNPAYEEFQREYAARYAAYSEPAASRRRKGFRTVHMALIFTLGAAAGLTGAWWADSLSHRPAASTPVPGIVSAKPALPPYEQLIRRENAQGTRGIRSSELPYDGRPPEQNEELNGAASPAAPLSSAAISSGGSDEEAGATAAQRTEPSVPAPVSETAKASAASAASTNSTKEAPIASADRAAGSAEARAQDLESRALRSAAAAKRSVPARGGKDQEIERIRRQADDELKKKSGESRIAQKSQTGGQSANTVSSSNSYKALLARCEASPNIFRREQCKWNLCNGMWGKNGCPSYAKPNKTYQY